MQELFSSILQETSKTIADAVDAASASKTAL